jgi:hypothetical protein
MLMMKFTAVGAAILLSGTAVVASAQEGQDSQQTAEAPKQEKKICRTSRMTGSLTRRTRICMTAAEWRALNDRTRRGLDEFNNGASGGKMCVPDPADPYQGCPG